METVERSGKLGSFTGSAGTCGQLRQRLAPNRFLNLGRDDCQAIAVHSHTLDLRCLCGCSSCQQW